VENVVALVIDSILIFRKLLQTIFEVCQVVGNYCCPEFRVHSFMYGGKRIKINTSKRGLGSPSADYLGCTDCDGPIMIAEDDSTQPIIFLNFFDYHWLLNRQSNKSSYVDNRMSLIW